MAKRKQNTPMHELLGRGDFEEQIRTLAALNLVLMMKELAELKEAEEDLEEELRMEEEGYGGF